MLLLVYAATLLLAALVSERARRTVLSTAVLFLVAGGLLGVAHGPAPEVLVRDLAEVALVVVLFTDGMRVPLSLLRRAWHLPGRALLAGFPLTLVGNAAAAHVLVHLSWPESLLVGAALAPTDPVFASAIVGRDEIPARLRHLLNVESGLNDGLALPFVVVFSAWATHARVGAAAIAGELGLGVLLGVAIPWLAVRFERTRVFGAAAEYRRVGVFAVGMLVFAVARVTRGNVFLASFAAGVVLATVAPRAPAAFAQFGETAAELVKLAALLVFGSMLSPGFVASISWGGWAFAFVTLIVVRPLSLLLSLLGSGLSWREQAAAAWFGPKGFASVVYGLLIASSGIASADLAFHLIAITTGLSIVLHSSTDVPVARWFERTPPAGAVSRL